MKRSLVHRLTHRLLASCTRPKGLFWHEHIKEYVTTSGDQAAIYITIGIWHQNQRGQWLKKGIAVIRNQAINNPNTPKEPDATPRASDNPRGID